VGSYGLIVKTTDGGTSWSQQSNFQYSYSDHSSEINTMDLNSIAVSPPSPAHPHSYALPRSIGHTTRLTAQLSRLPWTVLPRRVLKAHRRWGRAQAAPGATASTQLWVVGDKGLILMTTDGGISWDQQNSGVTQRLNDVAFSSATNGYAVGNGGTILKTTNGGGTWVTQRSGPPATPPFGSATSGSPRATFGLPAVTTRGLTVVGDRNHLRPCAHPYQGQSVGARQAPGGGEKGDQGLGFPGNASRALAVSRMWVEPRGHVSVARPPV